MGVVAALAAGTLGVITQSPASAADSNVTVLHGIPGVTVDVYVDGALTLEDFEPKDVAGPLALPPDDYDIEVFSAGADPGGTPVIEQTVTVPDGEDVSLIANLNGAGTPVLSAFVDDAAATPQDSGRVVVRHTAAAPTVDIQSGDADIVPNLAYGTEDSIELPAGSYPVSVQVSPDGATALDLGTVPVAAGQRLTVWAIGSASGGTLDVLVQAEDVGAESAVRVLHGIPGVTVDVYVGGALTLEDFQPKNVAGPLGLAPGSYEIEVFGANADPAGTPVISQNVTVPSNEDVAVIANLNNAGTPVLSAFVEDQSPTAAGQGRVVVRHTANAPTVDIQAGGADLFANLVYGAEAAGEVPAGSYPVAVQVSPSGSIALDLGDVAVTAGQRRTVYAIGSAGGGTLDVIVDDATVGQSFTDVPADHPFITEVSWLVDEGISTGYPDGSFRPAVNVTRQAFAAFLYRWSGSPEGLDPTCASSPFTDVPVSSPFCGEIAWLADADVFHGFNDGTFQPTATVSRQAAVASLYRVEGSPNGVDPTCAAAAFTDVPANHPFCGEIDWAVDQGLVDGYPDGSFRPDAGLTRQAGAAFLYRYDGLVNDE